MNPRHKISASGIDLIKSFEGYRRRAAQLPDGRWTIGYGHTKSAREGAEVSEADASALLLYDLMAVTSAVNDLTFTPLTQNQFDALVCFAFNVGVETFRKSTVLRRINEGAMLQAACSFEMWRKAEFEGERIVVDALVRRRAAEKALFLKPTDGWVAAPSPVLRPSLDYDVCASVPKIRPAELTTTLDGDTAVLVREDQPLAAPAPPLAPEADVNEPAVAPSSPVPVPLAQAEPTAMFTAPAEVEGLPATLFPAPALAPEAVPASRVAHDPRSDFDLPTPPSQDVFPGGAANETYALAQSVKVPEPEPELFERPTPPAPWPGYQAVEAEPVDEALTTVAASADLFDRPIYQAETYDVAEADHGAAAEVQPLQFRQLPLVILLLIGLALFAGAMFWGSHARPTGGLLSPVNVGVAFGLFGIGCAVVAGYTLLKRLGEREE